MTAITEMPFLKRLGGVDTNGIAYQLGNRATRRWMMRGSPKRWRQNHMTREQVRNRLFPHLHGSERAWTIPVLHRVRFFLMKAAWTTSQALRAAACLVVGHKTIQNYCLRCRRLI